MSAFEQEMTVDMNNVPTRTLERAYWRRKLPPAFRFYLEMLARELMLSQPDNINAHAAGFFEELLIQRDTELSLLPHQPYLNKLNKTRTVTCQPSTSPYSGQKPGTMLPVLPVSPISAPSSVKCTRCGKFMKSGGPLSIDGSMQGDPGAASGRSSGLSGRSTSPGRPESPRVTAVCNHLEGDNECRVLALAASKQKDPFGRLPARREKDDEEIISTRSLAILLDY